MIAWGIVIVILLFIALLRFGVRAQYSTGGVLISLIAGPFSLKVYPTEKDPEKEKKKADKLAKKNARKEKRKKPKKGAPEISFKDIMDMIPHVFKMLGRVKRRILISQLIVHFTVGGSDASKIAMTYGAANAAVGELIPVLDNNFRIRRREISFDTDFISGKQTIYAKVAVTLAVWELFYIVFALLPIIGIVFRKKPVKKDANKEKNEAVN